jgi:hypothetical protein
MTPVHRYHSFTCNITAAQFNTMQTFCATLNNKMTHWYLISYIRVLSADCGVVLYVQCWTTSSASTRSYGEHCPNNEMCFFSKHTHLTEHINLNKVGMATMEWLTLNQVTQDPYFIWQLLLVTCLCYSAACVGDQLYGYVNMINTPTASGSWQLWDKVRIMTLCKVDARAVLPCRRWLHPA